MIPFREQKIKNAIAYFASEFYRRRNYYPRQTWIYKFLALLDFRMLKKTGIPSLGLEYDAMQYGPVPTELYYCRSGLETDKFRFIKTWDGGSRVEATADYDLDFFSDDELEIMDNILNVYSQDSVYLENLIEDAHKEIKAWNKAWAQATEFGKGRMPMEYEDELDNPSKKNGKDLSPEEERFLFYKKTEEIENAEAFF